MIREKKEELIKDAKAYVGEKTLEGAKEIAAPVLKILGITFGFAVSTVFIYKAIQKLK